MNSLAAMLTVIALASGSADQQVVDIGDADRSKWWTWTNPPAFPPDAGALYKLREPAEVLLAYTIESDGTVTHCSVVSKTNPELPNDLLCRLVETHEYEAATENPERTPVRTSFRARLGPPGADLRAYKPPSAPAEGQ